MKMDEGFLQAKAKGSPTWPASRNYNVPDLGKPGIIRLTVGPADQGGPEIAW
jgi:hypothetical protein